MVITPPVLLDSNIFDGHGKKKVGKKFKGQNKKGKLNSISPTIIHTAANRPDWLWPL